MSKLPTFSQCRESQAKTQVIFQARTQAEIFLLNRPPDQTDVEILHLENKMKNMAEETTLGLRRIFDEVSSENPEAAAKISFTRMESAMSKRRHKSRCVN